MKCPKCGYLGFEHVERCRNCGYEFSLNVAASDISELSMRSISQQSLQPLADLALVDSMGSHSAGPVRRVAENAVRHPLSAELGPTPELPLFGASSADDAPLITSSSPPRTPLAVRRATPEVPRLRSEPRATMFDVAPAEHEAAPLRPVVGAERTIPVGPERNHSRPAVHATAPMLVRAAAVGIDLGLLLGIDAGVVYFTLQICGLSLADVAVLPRPPMIVFLVLQNISYLVAFTAGGQTMGQMATGIKVVQTTGAQQTPGLGAALVRTAVWLALAAPVGLGLLTVPLTRDGRGLHDRAAGTRVVRVPA